MERAPGSAGTIDPVREDLDLRAEISAPDHQYDTVAGARWLLIGFGAQRLVRMAVSLVLPKYLVATDYALVAIAMMVVNVANIVGPYQLVGHALVHKRESGPRVEGTAFVLISVIGLCMYGLMYASAPAVARFFEEPRVTPVLRALGLLMVFGTGGAMSDLLLSKSMSFRKKVVPDIAGATADLIVAVPAAVAGLGVWAIVAGSLAMNGVRNALLIAASPWRPRLRFDPHIAGEFLRYGVFCVTAAAGFVALQSIDKVVLGKGLTGLEALGYYGLAFNFATMIWLMIHIVNIRVMFPSYSRMQDDPDLMLRAYYKTVRFISAVAIPAYAGLFFLGRPFFLVMYGTKWEPCMTAFRILCAFGLIQCFLSDSGNVFKAMGRPVYLHWITTVTVLILFVGGFAAVRASSIAEAFYALTPTQQFPEALSGINAFSWVTLLSGAVSLAVSLGCLGKLIGVRARVVFAAMVTPALASAPPVLLEWWGLQSLLEAGCLTKWNVVSFIPLVACGYVLCLAAVDTKRFRELLDIGRQALGPLGRRRTRKGPADATR